MREKLMVRQPWLTLILAVGLMLWASFVGFAVNIPNFPPSAGYVLDRTGTLSGATVQQLNQTGYEIERKTGAQIVVYVVPSLEGTPEEEYALQVLRTWKIGKTGENNGAVILMAMTEKRIRVEVGYGLEGVLNDAQIGEMLDKGTIPFFKKGDYGTGLLNIMTNMGIAVAKDKQISLDGKQLPATQQGVGEGGEFSLWEMLLWGLGLIVFLFIDFTFFRGQLTVLLIHMFSRGGGGSGGRGGFGGRGSGGGSGGGGGAGRGW